MIKASAVMPMPSLIERMEKSTSSVASAKKTGAFPAAD